MLKLNICQRQRLRSLRVIYKRLRKALKGDFVREFAAEDKERGGNWKSKWRCRKPKVYKDRITKLEMQYRAEVKRIDELLALIDMLVNDS